MNEQEEIEEKGKPSLIKRLFKFSVYSTIFGFFAVAIVIAGLFLYITPNLPSTHSLKDVRFQVPLRVYSEDNKLMGEFGEKRRIPLRYAEVPENLVHAVLGAEDDRFFEHPGVDYHGILRAIMVMATTGKKAQGGSTITMQVARNFFLTREKTFLRKFSEIFLALQIEQELSKEEILSLYLNKIYLGNRSYGVAAAASVYYGKDINKLNLPQLAMIAGLPKAPSRYNPIVNPKRALLRRDYVLRRMLDLRYISQAEYDVAVNQPVTAKIHSQRIELDAPYAAEMVRKEMIERFGNDAYTEGYKVHTTVNAKLQAKANRAVQYNLLAYEERHGYRGAEDHLDVFEYDDPESWKKALKAYDNYPLLQSAVVIDVNDDEVYAFSKDGNVIRICWRGLKWAAPYVNGNIVGAKPKTAHQILSPGDVIRAYDAGKGRWSLGQIPEVEGAMVSLNSLNGGIQSIVGGFDFYHSKFNRVTQAKRQPGSNFKAFVYSSALEKGYSAASLINDAPVVFNDPGLEESWRPENYSGKFFGPTRLREALVKSRNLVSIRILRSVGIKYAINYVKRFGFDTNTLPKDLSLALGSATLTPLEIVRGYAAFSNGGYLVDPHIISRILGPQGELIYEANPPTVCPKCTLADAAEQIDDDPTGQMTMVGLRDAASRSQSQPIVNLAKRIVSAENVYIMTTIMQDIIKRGTGRRARVLKRSDIAGKTGTTNDQRDAWFSGFNGEIATTAWVGFDQPHPLGDFESGARAALPMWIDYMRLALKSSDEKPLMQPEGIVTVKIDPETGLLAPAGFPNAIFESFRKQNVPAQSAESKVSNKSDSKGESFDMPEQLF